MEEWEAQEETRLPATSSWNLQGNMGVGIPSGILGCKSQCIPGKMEAVDSPPLRVFQARLDGDWSKQ